ncbi:UNVERIFIED_CONTAM: hypothetical protein RMT77_004114 [Armadillidium vulgare]
MPKSKRSKKVSLTKIKKKDLDSKQAFIDEIRNCANTFKRIFIFSFDNIKNSFIKEIRLAWRDSSRLFFCKNRVMAVALGRTSGEEIDENLHLVSGKLMGNRGLLFTNAKKKDVLEYFDSYSRPEYPHAGSIATERFEVPEGPLKQFAHSLEPYLRKLGLPTVLQKGVPTMLYSHVVCKEGDVLKPEQAKLLKLFDRQTAQFKLTMEFMWSKKNKSFEDFGRTKDVVFITKSKKNPKDRKLKSSEENEEGENIDSDSDDEMSVSEKDEEASEKEEEVSEKDEENREQG